MACDLSSAAELAHCLRDRRRPFTHGFDARIGRETRGPYAFWLNSACLYIGMSISIRRRIYQHRKQEHNEKLERYFKAFWQNIEASFVPLAGKSESELRDAERAAIRVLRPRANKTNVS